MRHGSCLKGLPQHKLGNWPGAWRHLLSLHLLHHPRRGKRLTRPPTPEVTDGAGAVRAWPLGNSFQIAGHSLTITARCTTQRWLASGMVSDAGNVPCTVATWYTARQRMVIGHA